MASLDYAEGGFDLDPANGFLNLALDGPVTVSDDLFANDGVLTENDQVSLNGALNDGFSDVVEFTGQTATYIGALNASGESVPVFTLDQDAPPLTAGSVLVFDNTGSISSGLEYTTFLNPSMDTPLCFATGTLIATPAGEVPVETLAVGDPLLTARGELTRVKWVGRYTTTKLFTPAERFRPVRIAAGALGENKPHSDLVVTKDHGLELDGVIVHAGALVNGTSITEVPMDELAEQETYWHVETEEHAVLLANGSAAETFIDNAARSRFDNYAEFEALYGAQVPEMQEVELPRASSPRQVPQRIKRLVEERARAIGIKADEHAA